MINLEYNFQEQCTNLYNNWYEEIRNILFEKNATVGVALKGIPEFLKCITYTISLTVRIMYIVSTLVVILIHLKIQLISICIKQIFTVH